MADELGEVRAWAVIRAQEASMIQPSMRDSAKATRRARGRELFWIARDTGDRELMEQTFIVCLEQGEADARTMVNKHLGEQT